MFSVTKKYWFLMISIKITTTRRIKNQHQLGRRSNNSTVKREKGKNFRNLKAGACKECVCLYAQTAVLEISWWNIWNIFVSIRSIAVSHIPAKFYIFFLTKWLTYMFTIMTVCRWFYSDTTKHCHLDCTLLRRSTILLLKLSGWF